MQGDVGDGRQARRQLLDRQQPEHGGHRGAQQLASTERPDGSHRIVDGLVARLDRSRFLLQRETRARPQGLVVVEPRHRLGDPLHQFADIARTRQHAREPFGCPGRVAQHPEEPRGVSEALADASEREQPVVRIDAIREPPDHDGHQVALDGRLAADAARQATDGPQGPGRVAKTDRREPVVRLRGRQHATVLGQRGDRRQERSVEQPDMDVSDLALNLLPDFPHPFCRLGEAGCPSERAQPLGRAWHEVRPGKPPQLQAVLEQPQNAIVLCEGGCLDTTDVPAAHQRVECRQGAAADIRGLEAAAPRMIDTSGDRFRITLGTRNYDSRSDAAHALAAWMGDSGLKWLPRYGHKDFGTIGRISGFDIHVEARSGLAALDVTVSLPEVPRSGFTMPKESFLEAGLGLVQRIENRVSGIPSLLDQAREDLEEAEQTVADTQQRLGQHFRHAQALADAEEDLARVESQLAAMQDKPAPEPAAPDSERVELTVEAVRAYEPNLGSREGAGREPAAPFVPAPPPAAPPSNAPRL